jgi:hypothetical protein
MGWKLKKRKIRNFSEDIGRNRLLSVTLTYIYNTATLMTSTKNRRYIRSWSYVCVPLTTCTKNGRCRNESSSFQIWSSFWSSKNIILKLIAISLLIDARFPLVSYVILWYRLAILLPPNVKTPTEKQKIFLLQQNRFSASTILIDYRQDCRQQQRA